MHDLRRPDGTAIGRTMATGNPYGFTARERGVITLVLQGLTSKLIGLKLGISHRTVEVHRARIMRKCGARNTSHLSHLLSTVAVSDAVPQRVFVEDIETAFQAPAGGRH